MLEIPVTGDAVAAAPVNANRDLKLAVQQNPPLSLAGLSEQVFARLFSGLVYAQIWEDPDVDMAALKIGPRDRIVTIGSGGCNALSYLVANPARVDVVDLNPAHVALVRLKLAGLAHLPDYEAFYRFHGAADDRRNLNAYRLHIRAELDKETRAYWEGRDLLGRKRISFFARNVYRKGLLGAFITWSHRIARLYGVDPRELLEAATMEDQRRFFDSRLAPLFEKRFIRWLTSRKWSLFGLGIPPQQYDALAPAGAGPMSAMLRQRLETLACGFPLAENYFASQAFGQTYGTRRGRPLPPYLDPANYDLLRAGAHKVGVARGSYTALLARKPAGAVDCFVLLDAQDWMSDAQLNDLWREITRTAAPGARVIFRTAGRDSVLPGRVDPSIVDSWRYEETESLRLHAQDRSSIYGGFHLYRLRGTSDDRGQ